MRDPSQAEIRNQLERWFRAGVAAVDPETATRRALDDTTPPTIPPALIATGKAAAGMARGAVDWLASHGLEPAGGLVVSHRQADPPHHRLVATSGDHPIPGVRSLEAARMLGEAVAALPTDTPVYVLLSGGTSALIAAPLDGISPDELGTAFELFHSFGLDIATMNGLRRRLTRWSGGRLAAALGARPLHVFVISDVIGNDLAVIGSGPLVAEPVDFDNVTQVLGNVGDAAALPISVRTALARGEPVEHRAIRHHIVADGRIAGAAIVAAAAAEGVQATLHRRPIVGDAGRAGAELARWIGSEIRKSRLPDPDSGILVEPVARMPVAHVWVSETTVTLPASHGHGGRAQQFALATAAGLATLDGAAAATVLVAGTDGRDGPTDAAGAIVHSGTFSALQRNRIDVPAVLARCDAYPALDHIGALLRTGDTGTNVADLVVVWMWNWY